MSAASSRQRQNQSKRDEVCRTGAMQVFYHSKKLTFPGYPPQDGSRPQQEEERPGEIKKFPVPSSL
jgi:hypothetical protein